MRGLDVPYQWWEEPPRSGTCWDENAASKYAYHREGIGLARSGLGPGVVREIVLAVTRRAGIDLSQYPGFPNEIDLMTVYGIHDPNLGTSYGPILNITQTYLMARAMVDPRGTVDAMEQLSGEGIQIIPELVIRDLVEISRGRPQNIGLHVYPKIPLHAENCSVALGGVRTLNPGVVRATEKLSDKQHQDMENYRRLGRY